MHFSLWVFNCSELLFVHDCMIENTCLQLELVNTIKWEERQCIKIFNMTRFNISVCLPNYLSGNTCTVTSPNITRPLTLCTSPSDYATFNQIKSFLLFNIWLLSEREAKCFHFMLSLLSRSGFWQKLENVV